MKYLSICSGIEAASVAFEPLGWRPLAFSEIEAFPRAVLKHHYPEIPCHGDFTLLKDEPWIVDADMLCGGTPCFPAGHMVLTSTGYVPIEDVRTGDMVMTHAGRMRRVLRHGTKMATVGTLKAVGMPEGLVCTEDHPFMSVQYRNQSTKRNGVYAKIEHVGTPEWTPAKDMPGKQWCALLNYDASNHTPESSKFHERECMYLAGFYLGDGWIRRWNGKKKMAVVFGINNAKYELLKPWLQGVKHTITNERTTIKVTICDTKLATWLSSQFGEGSHTKRIPAWVLGHRYRRELMRGYIDTDGGVRGGCLTINSVSRSLAYGACDLLNAEGYVASVALVETNSTTIIEGRTVNQADYFSIRAYLRTVSRKSREHHGMLLRKVTGYERGMLSVPVFNIEVEEDNSYILDGAIVHNCQAFSVAGNRQSLADDRGNLTLQFVLLADAIDHLRSTAGREPAWILWENVPGVLSTNDNAFGAFLGGLVGRTAPIPEPADGWTGAGVVDGPTRCAAYRVLNAEHFGLAQRRKRVFVLARGGAGRWAAADALLPIIEGSGWHSAPSRGTGKGTARGFETGPSGGRITDLAPTIDCRVKNGPIQNQLGVGVMEVIPEVTRPLPVVAFAQNTRDEVRYQGDGDICGTLAAEPGMKQTTYIAFDPAQVTSVTNRSNPQPGDPCHTLHRAEPPMLVRMREGKEGGGKGPLVSEDQSLTLATGNDQVLCTHEIVGSLCAESGPNTHGSRGVSGTQTMLQGYIQPTQSMQVRRLTPVECERLQGFPIVRQMLYIAACLDQASGSVDVALRCHRLQSGVWPADASELMQFAATAEGHSGTPQVSQEPLALVRVLMHSGAKVQELHSAGKLIWSVKSAEGQSECRQPTQVETIAHALALHGHVVAKEIMHGKEASPQNTSGFSHRKNGEVCVTLSIAGTKANASDATNGHHGDRPQFTTSELGQVIPKEGSTLTTALCSVLHAIAGCIPEQTLPESFCIAIEVGRGYTNIPWRGKPESPDGPRYKALGNSWAVPCARWIGERIKAIRP